MYAVRLPGRGTVSATVTPTDAAFNPLLHAWATNCPSWYSSASVQQCVQSAGAGAAETLTQRVSSLTPSSLFLVVDGVARTAGPFTLSVDLARPPASDTCTEPGTISLGVPVTGDLTHAFQDRVYGCFGVGPGPDVFYTFDAPTNGTRTVTLTPTGFDGRLT